MNDGCKLQSFNVKIHFTFFVNHFTAISYLSPVNWWNFFIDRLEAISFCSQYGISNSRNGFFTANIFGGMINDSSLSKGVIKSRVTLSINCRGCLVLLCFALIALISMSKFDAIFLDQCKSPEIVFRLYLFGILDTQGTAFLFSFRYTCVVTLPLKYLSNFWRMLGMSLINCEINLFLNCSENCVISSATKATNFCITDQKKDLCCCCNFMNSR